LLYYEDYTHIQTAIAREKQLKKWRKGWKIEMIRKENPELKDLAAEWY
jgi:putative endonuclease